MSSTESDRLLQKMARLGMNRRQLLQLMGTAGAATAASLQLDPVLAAVHWERSPGADRGSYEPRRGLAAGSLAKERAISWIENNAQPARDLADEIWGYA